MQSVSFDRAASFYDATRGLAPGSAERIRDAIVARTGITGKSRMLELGVGTGRVALPFLTAGYSYTGVDLSRGMLAVLRAKLPPGPPPALVEGDVTRLPFADGAFELAIGVHVLHLVADWRATLREAARVLRRPGGQLLLAGNPGSEPGVRANPEATPPAQAQRQWGRILAELGSPGNVGQPGIRPGDPLVREELEALGATVTSEELTEFERPPFSARMVVEGARKRIHSSDWARPDEVHNEAVARLERWLAEACPDPDTPYAETGRFTAVIAAWA